MNYALMIALLVSCFDMAAFAQAGSSPLDTLQPGEWYVAPTSRLDAVAPNPLPPGSQPDVVIAWSGGAYDTQRDRLIVWGGGHANYSGNEIYAFDIGTMTWSRIWGPTPNSQIPPVPGGPYEVYLDGNPSSRHTYDGIEYIPQLDQLWSNGGSRWGPTGTQTAATWVFDFATSAWTQKSTAPDAHLGVTSDWDPITQHIFMHTNYNFCEYNPTTGNYTVRQTLSGGLWATPTAALDPTTRKYVMVGGGGNNNFLVYDLNTWARTAPATSGDKTIETSTSPGFSYDPVAKKFVGWSGGANVYTLDDSTWTWTQVTPAVTNTVTPTAAVPFGTFGRFRYIPSKNCYIVVNAVDQNVYFYKLTAGGGGSNQPPVIQSPASATPSPVLNESTTRVLVAASDPDSAPSPLTYTWSIVSGPSPVTFSPNGTTGSATATATFSASGTYSIQVSVSDGAASVVSQITGLVVTLPTATPVITTADRKCGCAISAVPSTGGLAWVFFSLAAVGLGKAWAGRIRTKIFP